MPPPSPSLPPYSSFNFYCFGPWMQPFLQIRGVNVSMQRHLQKSDSGKPGVLSKNILPGHCDLRWLTACVLPHSVLGLKESKAFYLRPSQLSLGEVGECLLDCEIQAGRLQQAWQTSGIQSLHQGQRESGEISTPCRVWWVPKKILLSHTKLVYAFYTCRCILHT